MKPHDEWNSDDIAQYARTAQHIEPNEAHHSNNDALHEYYASLGESEEYPPRRPPLWLWAVFILFWIAVVGLVVT